MVRPVAPRWRPRHVLLAVIEGFGRAVALVLFAVLGVFLVAIPWLVFTVLGIEVVGKGSRRGGWSSVRGQRIQPERLWFVGSRRAPEGWRRPPQQWVAMAVVVAVVGVGIANSSLFDDPASTGANETAAAPPAISDGAPVTTTSAPDGDGDDGGGGDGDEGQRQFPQAVPAAYADAEWYPQYEAETAWAAAWGGLYRPVGGRRLPDAFTTYVKVKDGVRQTWSPPACDCRRLTVWMYGSASLFGVGQRDEHTIASELARAAWADGIALDVVNRGVPADQHWQEANRFAWDLTRFDPPDLVLFYDGVSDVNTASWLNTHHLGDVDVPIEVLTESFLETPGVQDALDQLLRGTDQDPPPAPEGVGLLPTPTVPSLDADGVGELAASRYARAREMSVDSVASAGIEGFWFWQPSLYSKDVVAGEPTSEGDDVLRAEYEAARRGLPEGVIDLSDAFDDIERPLFGDSVRHNEEGAALVAADMYDSIRPALDRLLSSGTP